MQQTEWNSLCLIYIYCKENAQHVIENGTHKSPDSLSLKVQSSINF